MNLYLILAFIGLGVASSAVSGQQPAAPQAAAPPSKVSHPAGVKTTGHQDICKSKNPGESFGRLDKCLKDESAEKKALLSCRQKVYGSKDSHEAIKKFCSKDEAQKAEFSKKFDDCMKEEKVSWESIWKQWHETCGFCKLRNNIGKADKCMSEGDVKKSWLECRQEVAGTRDPKLAADKYCAKNLVQRKEAEVKFFKCLHDKKVTEEKWAEAVKDCKNKGVSLKAPKAHS
jgi:hypothetical protein